MSHKIVGPFLIICIGLIFLWSSHYRHKKELRDSYERGAWAVMMYHSEFGNYGSMEYRDAAFDWGDPQSLEDLNKILEIAERNNSGTFWEIPTPLNQ